MSSGQKSTAVLKTSFSTVQPTRQQEPILNGSLRSAQAQSEMKWKVPSRQSSTNSTT
jgi:hypothetical protein